MNIGAKLYAMSHSCLICLVYHSSAVSILVQNIDPLTPMQGLYYVRVVDSEGNLFRTIRSKANIPNTQEAACVMHSMIHAAKK